MTPLHWALVGYLALVNLIAFTVYGADNRRARKDRRRVPEKTLFLLAIIGGSLGAFLGMRLFHHKTRHWYFVWGIPAIMALQIALGLWLTVQK